MLDYAASLAREQAKADAIPRFEVPDYVYYDDDEPETACWNCKHCASVYIGGKKGEARSINVCCLERDNGNFGDVEVASDYNTDCPNWEDDV